MKIRRIPEPTRCRTIRSRIGRPATRSIGLGTVSVSGRRRTPWPPAMTTAQFVRSTGSRNCVEQVQADRPAVARRRPGSAPIRRARMSSRTSARPSPGRTDDERRGSGPARPGRRGSAPARSARRRSPSVTTPTRRPVVVHGQARSGRRRGRARRIASRMVAGVGDEAGLEAIGHERRLEAAAWPATPTTTAPGGTSADDDGAHPDRRAGTDLDVVADAGRRGRRWRPRRCARRRR